MTLTTGDDPLKEFFSSRQINSDTAYLGNSEFVLGRELKFDTYRLIYRIEQADMLIVDFSAREDVAGLSGAVSKLKNLLKQIQLHVPAIATVRAMFPLAPLGKSELNEVRRRLAAVMLANGAQWRDDADGHWLVCPLR